MIKHYSCVGNNALGRYILLQFPEQWLLCHFWDNLFSLLCRLHYNDRGPGAWAISSTNIPSQFKFNTNCVLLSSIFCYYNRYIFSHAMAAQLPLHVQKFVAIRWPCTALQQNKIFIGPFVMEKCLWNRSWGHNVSLSKPSCHNIIQDVTPVTSS